MSFFRLALSYQNLETTRSVIKFSLSTFSFFFYLMRCYYILVQSNNFLVLFFSQRFYLYTTRPFFYICFNLIYLSWKWNLPSPLEGQGFKVWVKRSGFLEKRENIGVYWWRGVKLKILGWKSITKQKRLIKVKTNYHHSNN